LEIAVGKADTRANFSQRTDEKDEDNSFIAPLYLTALHDALAAEDRIERRVLARLNCQWQFSERDALAKNAIRPFGDEMMAFIVRFNGRMGTNSTGANALAVLSRILQLAATGRLFHQS
jgi:hypothetical protein